MSQEKFTALRFNAKNIPTASAGFDVQPAGRYKVELISASVVLTAAKSEKAQRVLIVAQILEGELTGKKIALGINYKNPSPICEQIGQTQISSICHATGKIEIKDVQEWLHIPFMLKIKVKAATDDFAASNDFVAADSVDATATPTPSGASESKVPAAALPKWAHKKGEEAAAPTPAAAYAAKSAGPKAPGRPKAPVQNRRFFVFVSETEMPIMTEAEISKSLADGMPADTQVTEAGPDDSPVNNEWKSTADFGINAEAPAAATPAGKPVAPPAPKAPAGETPWQKKARERAEAAK